ncbi:hypothetical protein HBI56_042840 [Parastagonospora nodorum]|uniref:2EXR domain-containing protein n=1 Tax=Phaeosphaeria nodorum (strain SN15 / ATCC MYA-4574 / FGSC 10173) TaxID=321614 RepID=A0A7U2HYB0_PHANO|nr:hypothetical protein HBH56_240270 [Parastagonospora nodorum]QRC93151.1 hypothetical protein JI435_033890 [Parastagonospora nodorum SN15]KAH3932322.1 hypothetical protein HBH54_084170 [Parastagonospora nodorum]KAH3954588.1 hypothetical protein HBH53_010200 [Parastagonospora nodorum]KAH3986537.1 hypothetical protein HBH52_041400 [Parastagonospora nodorum]
MPFWTRKPKKGPKEPKATPEQNQINSGFLKLPGELRNEIYSYVIYPTLRSITIAITQKRKARHFSESVLNPGVFRICHQVRAEAISYLCSAKHLKICGSDAAIAFFDVLGDGIRGVKRISIAQPIRQGRPLPPEQIDMLFYYLDQAASLKYFKIEMGKIGAPYGWSKDIIGEDWVFLEKVSDFVKEKDGMKFMWEAGAYDSRAVDKNWVLSQTARANGIRELLGMDHEGWGSGDVIRLW